jgi:GNAT superfamily N-acetyltransferase
MEVRRYDDPAAFRRDGAPLLLADPARNNLALGILQTLLDEPAVYPSFRLWLALDGDRPQGLALQTPPHNVVLAEPAGDAAVGALAEAAVADASPLPGITANLPWADRYAQRVVDLTGRRVAPIIGEGVWELTSVVDVPVPPGRARPADPRDRDVLRRWLVAFEDEALPPEAPRVTTRLELTLDMSLAGGDSGFWLWEDAEGMPVCVSGFRHVPEVGTRIGPVYTPPEHRRHGYAARLVAELSASRLAAGDPACFLYTDLANPTSNAVYARIGYVKVCDAVEYAFRG